MVCLAAIFFLGAARFGAAQEANLGALTLTFLPQSIDAGASPDSLGYSFKNLGPADIVSNSVVSELFLSRDAIVGNADDIRIWQYTQFILSSQAGGTIDTTLGPGALGQITIPADASGSYNVFMKVSYPAGSTYHDPDLSNNAASRVGAITVKPSSVPRLQGALVPRQGFQLTASGIAGRNYQFDGSTDLRIWAHLSIVLANSTGTAQYLDPATPTLKHRFYRAALLPP